jgi:large subunit ribosomal protein L23Ae
MPPSKKAAGGAKASAPKDVAKAVKAAKAARVGSHVRAVKVRTKVHFYRPKTKKGGDQEAQYIRSLPKMRTKFDFHTIIKKPLTTEPAMKKIEDHNTLVFLCAPMATKTQIKAAVAKLYGIKAAKVNTLIRPDGLKKAYVKLTSDFDALDVANKIGVL